MEWIALLLLVWLWRAHASRLNRLQRRIEKLDDERSFQEDVIQKLTQRLFRLERGSITTSAVAGPVAKPVFPEPQFMPESVPEFSAESIPVPVPAFSPELPPEPAFVPPALETPAFEQPEPAGPSYVDRMRGQNWEAMIGGSWLNALGILILVVSISLFLGYALTQFGPAGKVSIGIAMSLVMLAAGVFVERKEAYVTFGRGLIAGGWAALYFVAYAMHALEAARVIESPIVGGILLLLVSGGMIAHSLRYCSQTLTLLAYFSAYFALQIGPQSGLSIAATIPLALSLLTISRELGWNLTPIAGMVLTYFTFAFRYNAAELKPAYGAAALYSYWLAFEMYDILRLRSAAQRALIELTIFPLNAFLFIGTAFLTLPKSTPEQSAYFLATSGVVFLISTILRMRSKPEILPASNPIEHILAESHRLASTFSAALFAGALLRRFSPERSIIGLLMEAQLLVLAGLRTGERFFCTLGALIFGTAAAAVLFRADDFGKLAIGDWKFAGWTPFLLGMAVQYYFNRRLTRSGVYYTWGALFLLIVTTGELAGSKWSGMLWVGMAVVLVEVFLRTGLREFRFQAMTAAVLGFLVLWINGISTNSAEMLRHAAASGVGSLLLYWVARRLHPVEGESLTRDFAALLATLLASLAIWQALPAPIIAVAWGMLALLLLETGFTAGLKWIHWQGHVLAFCAFGRVFVANFPVLSETAGISHIVLTVTPLIVLAWHGWRRTPNDLHRFDTMMWHSYSWAGVILLGALLRFELGRMLVVLGWAGMMLVLQQFGNRLNVRDLRLQAYTLAVMIFARGWATNFSSDETVLGMPVRVVTGVLVVAAFHAAQFLSTIEDRRPRTAFAIMGSTLLSILLFYEVSGRMLTIAWGIQGALTLAAGFSTRQRVLRLTGLVLFGVCILKLFIYDLRNLDTLGRILSTFILGLVLMGASWLYMRFKDKIQRYL